MAQTRQFEISVKTSQCKHFFYKNYIAFHFKRDDVDSPWFAVGIYLVCDTLCQAKYLTPYKYMEIEFKNEIQIASKSARTIQFTYEFLDSWRRKNQDCLSVISPIITFYSEIVSPIDTIHLLFARYVGTADLSTYARLITMIRQKDGFFSFLYRAPAYVPDKKEIIKGLKELGYL